MQPRNRRRDLAALITLCGVLLFLPPYIGVFNRAETLLGVPLIQVYIFAVWLLGILVTARTAKGLIADRQPGAGDDA